MSTSHATKVQPSNWSELPVDLIDRISVRVLEEDLTHYVRFRGVCSSWRCFTTAPNCLESRFRPKNWVLMMAGVAEIATGNEKQSYLNIRNCTVLRTNILDLLPNYTILSIVDGLFVLMHNETTNVCFLNPITRSFTHGLPPLSSCVSMIRARNDQADVEHLRRMLLSVQFASSTVVIHFREFSLVAYAKFGDRRWSRIRERVELSSMTSFQDELYGVSRYGEVFKFVPAANARSFPILVHIVSILNVRGCYPYQILVESGGKLLLVTMKKAYRNYPCGDMLHLFAEVCEVDVQNSLLLPVTNLGDNALILCCNKALSLSRTLFPSLRNNFMCFIRSKRLPVSIFYTVRRDHYIMLDPNCFPMREISHPCVHRPFSIIDQMIFYCSGF